MVGYNSKDIPCIQLMVVINYANATLLLVVAALPTYKIWLLVTCHRDTNVKLKFTSIIPN